MSCLIFPQKISRCYFQSLASAWNKSSHTIHSLILSNEFHTHKTRTLAHMLMSSCTGNTGRYSGNRRGGGQRWSLLSCWEQTAILLDERWKWTEDEHAEWSDKRGEKMERGLTIAADRRLFPREWKRGHSATNQTKKSLIAPQALLAVRKGQGKIKVASDFSLQCSKLKVVRSSEWCVVYRSQWVFWPACKLGAKQAAGSEGWG